MLQTAALLSDGPRSDPRSRFAQRNEAFGDGWSALNDAALAVPRAQQGVRSPPMAVCNVHMSLPNAQMAVNEDQLALANVQMALTIVQ